MLRRLAFYLQYSLRNLRRGGRWTSLAILCITAGVATVVALRSLGLGIGDALTNNIRVELKGDMLIRKSNDSGFTFRAEFDPFTPWELNQIQSWAESRDATMINFMQGANMQIAKTGVETVGRPEFIGSYFIDPETYPPMHDIRALQPDGVPIAELFTGGNQIVISDNLAQRQEIQVGDTVRVSNTEELFTVVGIVATTNESSVRNILSAFFGFFYMDIEVAQSVIDSEYAPNRVSILFEQTPSAEVMEDYESDLRRFGRVDTFHELLEGYTFVSQILGDFIVVMGLGALLIGGVGIMNTMLVMVRRRTNEIAAVKTFGLKGRQVALLFMTEALLLGLIGSVLGSIIGILLSGVANQFGEQFIQQTVDWVIYPEALAYGFVLGIVITVVFGVAPVLTAVQVRPANILRPNENKMPGLGVIRSGLLLMFVTLSIGLIVGQIVRPSFELVQNTAESFNTPSPYLIGIISVTGTLLFIGLLIILLWILVWLIGKFPTFGNVSLRLALRNMSTHRLRTATTLLALSAGMLALSSITFVGEGARELLNLQLTQTFGGNVVVFPFPFVPTGIAETGINLALNDVPITYRTRIDIYNLEVVTVDGEASSTGRRDFNGTMWKSDNPNLTSANIVLGRDFNPEDRGQAVITLTDVDAFELNATVGSMLTLRDDSTRSTFQAEVIGIVASEENGIPDITQQGIRLAPEIPNANLDSQFTIFTYLVEEEYTNEALVALSSIPIVFSLDISFIDSLLSRLITQFAAIPTIVGILSLFAAAVIMANTVALSTLERQRQIGILKAIGLKARKVLTVMLIESSIIGLLSAVLGIGLSIIGVALFTSLGGTTIPLPQDARLTGVALVVIAILIGWLATFLSARVALRERVMNVLRYE